VFPNEERRPIPVSPRRDRPQIAEERAASRGEGHSLAPLVVWVAVARHEAPLLDVIEIADQVAPIDVEAVRELVLGERPEIR